MLRIPYLMICCRSGVIQSRSNALHSARHIMLYPKLCVVGIIWVPPISVVTQFSDSHVCVYVSVCVYQSPLCIGLRAETLVALPHLSYRITIS